MPHCSFLVGTNLGCFFFFPILCLVRNTDRIACSYRMCVYWIYFSIVFVELYKLTNPLFLCFYTGNMPLSGFIWVLQNNAFSLVTSIQTPNGWLALFRNIWMKQKSGDISLKIYFAILKMLYLKRKLFG